MFNQSLFEKQILTLQERMKFSLRGEIDHKIESSVIDELASIYSKMVQRYQQDVKVGSLFPAQPVVTQYPEDERVFIALQDLLERMELDFTQKFVLDFTHGLEKETEIGKIKISFLDGVRRSLQAAKN